MREILKSMVQAALEACLESGALDAEELPPWVVEVPRDAKHGDYATNVALVIASKQRRRPKDVADAIVGRLQDPEGVLRDVKIAPAGFINFFLNEAYLLGRLRDILKEGSWYGRSDLGNNKKIQIEFVSANPTGPLHVGHGRGAVLGDALARILEFVGYRVSREYYINDMGNQMNILGQSVYMRYLELDQKRVDYPQHLYQGEYIKDIASKLMSRFGDRLKGADRSEAVDLFREEAYKEILDGIKRDLLRFGIEFDCWFSERSLYRSGTVEKLLKELFAKGLAYRKDGALWLRTSDYGDDKDRVLVKSDGDFTYFASDVAYHANKLERGFNRIIDIWGADHHGYLPRMKGLFRILGRDENDLTVIFVQLVNLMRNGVPVAMSTRAAEFITLREVLDEVGVDAARYLFLMRTPESPLDFDLELAKKKEKDNPVYYVQYAHARICSILEEARERGFQEPVESQPDLELLSLQEERSLIRKLAAYPEVVKAAARALEPHRIVIYLGELATLFHNYYNKGWIDRSCRVLSDDREKSLARLLLVKAVRIVLQNGLGLLGVSAPKKM